MATAPPVHATLLLRGEPACAVAGTAPVRLETMDALLLAYLCIEGSTSRATLAAVLWPEVDAARARGNLRQRLLRLRHAIGLEVVTGKSHLSIAEHVSHDAAPDDELLAAVALDEAGGLADWLATKRSARRNLQRDALAAQASQLESEQRLAEAIVIAQRLVDADPNSEHAHRRLMRLHYLRGDRSAALAAYTRCAATLAQDLGARPSSETLQLKLQIEKSTALALTIGPTPVWLLRPPRLVGRASELARLVTAVAAGSHALLLGDAGMGKSRLLAELGALKTTVSVQGRPGDEHSPYVVLARLLRALFTLGVQPDEEVRAELARIVPECGLAATSKFDRGGFENAVESALECALGSVSAVLIDDLHFADFASVELLARVGAAESTPRFVFGARPAECAALLALLQTTLGETRRLEQIELAALPLPAIEELLASLELPRFASGTLAATVARHTGGNPQFILETLKALLAEDRTGSVTTDHLPLPHSVGLLIERRLRQLSAPAIRLARVAAVAGSDFSPTLAAAVLVCRPVDLADAWGELEEAAVLSDHRFAHDLVYETTLGGVPAAIARDMHGAVAQVLLDSGADAARIAEHWLRADATDKALPLLLVSAQRAMGAMCNHEAAQQFEKAIAIQAQSGDTAGEFKSLLALFDCLQDLERRAQVDSVLARLFELAATPTRQAKALEARARALLIRLDLEPALAAASASQELALAAGDMSTAFDARLALTQTLVKLGRVEEAEATLTTAHAFADNGASPNQRSYFYEAAALMVHAAERFEESGALWRKLETSAIEMKALRTVATALNYQTLSEGQIGSFRQAAATGERWRQYLIDNGLFGEARQYLDLNLAYVYHHLGHYDAVLQALQRAEALGVTHHAALHSRYAGLFVQLGQFARVRQHLDALPPPEQMEAGLRLGTLLQRLRLARLSGTRPPSGQGAADVLAHAEQVVASTERVVPRVRWMLARAEFLEGDAAVEAAREAGALAQAKGLHGSRISAEVLLARALVRQGDVQAALPRVRIALALAASYQPDCVYFAEVGQIAHQVLTLNGESGDAVLRSTVDWIQHTSAHHVPAEFRDSFMHRNPVNRDLLAAASRLGTFNALPKR